MQRHYTVILFNGSDSVTEVIPIVATDDTAAIEIARIAEEIVRDAAAHELWRDGRRIAVTLPAEIAPEPLTAFLGRSG